MSLTPLNPNDLAAVKIRTADAVTIALASTGPSLAGQGRLTWTRAPAAYLGWFSIREFDDPSPAPPEVDYLVGVVASVPKGFSGIDRALIAVNATTGAVTQSVSVSWPQPCMDVLFGRP
jgi:hypothetical protein